MNQPAHLFPADQANLLAGKAVAHATAYLDGRDDAEKLARHARSIQIELLAPCNDVAARPLVDASRMLAVAMTAASWANTAAREDRWQNVMGALVELVRHESNTLREAPRSLVTPEDVATEWRR